MSPFYALEQSTWDIELQLGRKQELKGWDFGLLLALRNALVFFATTNEGYIYSPCCFDGDFFFFFAGLGHSNRDTI